LFALSVFAIVPLAALLSHATESVAAKTGDAVGGLLNATLGNLTELVIALAACAPGSTCWKSVHRRSHRQQHALHAGCLVPARRAEVSHAGIQPDQRAVQAGLLFLATIALLVPSALSQADSVPAGRLQPAD
jgi:Ca2+:H+ antiporter